MPSVPKATEEATKPPIAQADQPILDEPLTKPSSRNQTGSVHRVLGEWLVLGPIALFSLATAIGPLLRSFYRFEVNYNEGWNTYAALRVTEHLPLYGERYSWTTVNYPALSFHVVAYLSRLTHDPLLTGRMLSLISLAICCAFVALAIRKVTEGVTPALLGASFCLAIFCTQSPLSIGANDPQVLPYIFFVGGFLLYFSSSLSGSASTIRLAAVALLFVIGGNIKHNPVDFPLAVFLDCWFACRRKAWQFLLFCTLLGGSSIFLNIVAGGPFFLSNLLSPRSLELAVSFPVATTLPFVVALFWAIRTLKKPGNNAYRPIALLFLASMFVGFAFGFGSGVAVNTFFSNFLATSIIMGILLDSAWRRIDAPLGRFSGLWRRGIPVILCSGLIFSFLLSGDFNFSRRLAEMRDKEAGFRKQVDFLRAQPGAAICESLLCCYEAGKPYVYDPFNATRLMRFGKLRSSELVARIDRREFGAIQLRVPVESVERPSERFPDEVLDAIGRDYMLSVKDADCAIYVPRTAPAA